MARTPNRRQREAARQRSLAATEARQASVRRRQRIIAVVVVAVVVLSIVGAVLGSRSGTTSSSTTPSTTTSVPVTSTNPDLPAGGVTPVAAPMGEALTGSTPCPAEDGSSPRVTLFAEAPPNCIDPAYFHMATIRTTQGDLTVQLNPKVAPNTVNAFVVLAHYHFYDGQPVTSVRSRASFTVGLAFTGDRAADAPGFTIPAEATAQGAVQASGLLSMLPSGSPAANRGELLFATFEEAPGIDPSAVTFGVTLSGDDTIAAIDALATQDDLPAEAVTITSITVVRTSLIPT